MSAPAVAVREGPILFSGSMVRAILDGTKTQTRRVVRLRRPDDELTPDHGVKRALRHITQWWVARSGHYPCPYGQPGDQLWVRERWAAWATVGAGDLWRVQYRADNTCRDFRVPEDWTPPRCLLRDYTADAPSIFLPRWASRLTLELTSVRVERVQDISEDDAIAEGAEATYPPGVGPPSFCHGYKQTWDALNRKRGFGWHVNPWVWVLTFTKVTP